MPRDLERLLKNTAKKAIALAQDDALNAGEDPPTVVTFFMPPALRPFVNLSSKSAAQSNGSTSTQAKSRPPPSSASNKTATSSGSTSNQDTATPNVANLSK